MSGESSYNVVEFVFSSDKLCDQARADNFAIDHNIELAYYKPEGDRVRIGLKLQKD
jgi:hypothetical protein